MRSLSLYFNLALLLSEGCIFFDRVTPLSATEKAASNKAERAWVRMLSAYTVMEQQLRAASRASRYLLGCARRLIDASMCLS